MAYSLPACPQPPVLWARVPVISWLPAGPRHIREDELKNQEKSALNFWPPAGIQRRMIISKRTTTKIVSDSWALAWKDCF
jgi:hypothetical protein